MNLKLFKKINIKLFADKKTHQISKKAKNIIKNVKNQHYELESNNDFVCFKSKKFNDTKPYFVVSSHIDTVYSKNFSKIKDGFLYGTLDNSITNYILIEVLNEKQFDQVVFAFTNGEEINMQGISMLEKKFINSLCFICTDVTPTFKKNIIATIENDKYGIAKNFCCSNVLYIPFSKCFNDEAKFLCKQNKKAFSFCLPCEFVNNLCHNDFGGKVDIKTIENYKKALLRIIYNYDKEKQKG